MSPVWLLELLPELLRWSILLLSYNNFSGILWNTALILRFCFLFSSLSITSHLHISLIFCTLPLLPILWDPPHLLLLYHLLAGLPSMGVDPHLWNALLHHICNIDSLPIFKASLILFYDCLFCLILCCWLCNSMRYWLLFYCGFFFIII